MSITVTRSCQLNDSTGIVFERDGEMLKRYEGVRIFTSDDRTFDHLTKVVEEADKAGLLIGDPSKSRTHLLDWFDYMNSYRMGTCRFMLYKDFSPLSFTFHCLDGLGKHYFTGGLIYHGKGSQGMEQLSVRITPAAADGWDMHT